MAFGLHNLKADARVRKTHIRVGRGNATGHGSFSGRGCKGQRSRSGGKKGLKYKGFKHNLSNFPKYKGDKPRSEIQEVSLSTLNIFAAGDTVTPVILFEKMVIATLAIPVKILKRGEISVAVTVEGCRVTAGAKELIEKAGGKVIVPAVETEEKE